MAKKRATRKPKGLDDTGRIIDLSDPYTFPGTHRTKDAPSTYGGPMSQGAKAPLQGQADPNRSATGRAYETYQQYRSSTDSYERSERIRALKNMQDLARNVNAASPSGQKGPFAMGKAPDSLSGRTPDAGTRSLLQGMKNFMKSGARGAFLGGIRGGGGGRPGTRL